MEEIYKVTLCRVPSSRDGRFNLVLFARRAITMHDLTITDTKEYLERKIGAKAMMSILHSPSLAFDEEVLEFSEDSDAAAKLIERCEAAPIDVLKILAESSVQSDESVVSVHLYATFFDDDLLEKLGLKFSPSEIAQEEN